MPIPQSACRTPPLYPIFRDLVGQRCVVVGGGQVAARKAAQLVRCGARVRVVSPECCPELSEMNHVQCVTEAYHPRWLEGAVVVIAATDARGINRRVCDDARRLGAWVNVVDRPDLCDFHVPATVCRSPVQIAVSTGGSSPALARRVRQFLEETIDEAYGQLAELIGEFRPRIFRDVPDPVARRALLEELASDEWLQRVRTEGPEATRQAMHRAIAARTG